VHAIRRSRSELCEHAEMRVSVSAQMQEKPHKLGIVQQPDRGSA
jgi:hypothetical protein